MPQLVPCINMSTKQFGFSLVDDALKAWNELLDDIQSVTSLLSFRKKLKRLTTLDSLYSSDFLCGLLVLFQGSVCSTSVTHAYGQYFLIPHTSY